MKRINRTNRSLALCLLMLSGFVVHGQVLISLFFGEALNTPKIEFGLVGGLNQSYILPIPEATPKNNFNIGFYFHINLAKQSYLSTGVLVKSEVGAKGMEVYSRNDADFDALFVGGELAKQIHYFYVPVMYHHRFNNNRWYAEGGFQLGLRNKSWDIFTNPALDGDLTYKLDTRDQYKHLDAGFLIGAAYKLKKEIKSMSVGFNYYYGLVNVSLTDQEIRNSSVYFYLKIPIGAASAEK